MEPEEMEGDGAVKVRRKEDEFWRINFETLPYKIHYFLFLGSGGAVLPFMAVFSKWKFDLSGSQLASIFATQQFLTVLTKPAIGAVVDRFNKMKFVMIMLIMLTMFFFFMVLIIPGSNKHHQFQEKFAVALSLDCDTATIDDISCQLKENVCYSRKHLENKGNSSAAECFDPDVRKSDSDLCYDGRFLCCGPEKQFVPHSSKQESFRCKKLPLYSGPSKAGVREDNCIPFTITENDNSSRLQSHALSLSAETDVRERSINETIFFCTQRNAQDAEAPSNSTARATEAFIYTHETSYLCLTDLKTDPYCGALEDISSMDFCLFRSNSIDDTPRCKNSRRHQSASSPYNIWFFSLLLIGGNICINSMFTLSDTACHESLQKTGGDYGKQRVWGSVAFGVMSPFAGMLNDFATEAAGHPDYTPGFYLYGALASLQIVNMLRLDLQKPNLRGSILKHVGTLFKSPTFVMFEFGVLMTGFFTGVIWFYLLLFLQTIGSSKLLMGLVLTTECVLGELPLMYFSGWILKRTGYANALVITSLCFALRFSWYHFLYNPWWVLPVEITHGVCYGLFYAAMTSFAKSSAPKGAEATTQSILGCTYSSLGSGLGCVVTGVCFDHFGSRRTFLGLSFLSLVVAIIQFIGWTWLRRHPKPVRKTDPGIIRA